MALTYTSFQTYPLQIVGIDSQYNAKIAAIEAFVNYDIAYSGDETDVSVIVPYFVFWYLCQDETSTVVAGAGENTQLKENSIPSVAKQVEAWNMGVNKLRAVFGITDDVISNSISIGYYRNTTNIIHYLVISSGKTVNEKYLSKRSLL